MCFGTLDRLHGSTLPTARSITSVVTFRISQSSSLSTIDDDLPKLRRGNCSDFTCCENIFRGSGGDSKAPRPPLKLLGSESALPGCDDPC
mmetsp:Transcript_27741/g.45871  ORF Transcript_27741/g.45871 Transcript_27741/m.45871 type:complete len:90 (-) Transcript_27741:471-740(-)